MATTTVTTVILIRQADRYVPPVGPPDDPGPSLNDKGMARSKKLVHVLSTAGIQAVYSSHFTRAKMKAKPFFVPHSNLPAGRLEPAPRPQAHIFGAPPRQNRFVLRHIKPAS